MKLSPTQRVLGDMVRYFDVCGDMDCHCRLPPLLPARVENAAVAQLVERVLGKDEVTGPNPVSSSQGHEDWSQDTSVEIRC